jgi:hypothetical protein
LNETRRVATEEPVGHVTESESDLAGFRCRYATQPAVTRVRGLETHGYLPPSLRDENCLTKRYSGRSEGRL